MSYEQGDFEQELNKADIVQVFTTDLNGRPITLQVNPQNVDEFFKRGIGFDGSSVAGYGTVDDSDKVLIPIPDSYRLISFPGEKLGFFIGRIEEEQGERSLLDPRGLLERVLIQAEEEFGYRFLAGPEHEFFLLKEDEYSEDIHTDKAGYFHADPKDKGEVVRKEIVSILEKCGIRFEKMHHEVTPSQHEINLSCLNPLSAADRTVLFTYVTKRVANDQQFHATFMPKPFNGHNRNALHVHLSMQDKNGQPLFYDENDAENISPLARYFIGGILKYARSTSIVMASTYNSYKAYIVGKEAPIKRGWAARNRSSMVRIPYADSPSKIRIELRSPDPAGNIYLQMATFIAMGLQGIREKSDCGSPDDGNVYEREDSSLLWDESFLPRSMFEALVEAEKSSFLRNHLGDTLYRQYMLLKKKEWEGYRTYVTPREHKLNLST